MKQTVKEWTKTWISSSVVSDCDFPATPKDRLET
jgi:hypothetical protein